MLEAIQSIQVEPANATSKMATAFLDQPMLRFGDATRATSDGAIWKLGENRPDVVIAMEFTHSDDRTLLQYEFLCLTDESFDLKTSEGWTWTPSDSAIKWKTLRAPVSTSAPQRFRQLKQIVRRFSATEVYEGQRYTLRLLVQPIDRYKIPKTKHDGAVFVFANGTNPEVLVLIESSDEGWKYAFARLCGAAPEVTLNGETVWKKPSMNEIGKSWKLNYTGDAREMD